MSRDSNNRVDEPVSNVETVAHNIATSVGADENTNSAARPAPKKKGESKRDRIVRLAAELFLERGYDGVSINDVIEVTGGSKGTIYSYFGSREGLFEAVIAKMTRDVTIQIDIGVTGSIEEQLTRIGRSFSHSVLTPQVLKFHRLVMYVGRTFPEAGRLFYDTGPRSACGKIATWIKKQQDAGALRAEEDPFRLAILFHDMLIGESIMLWNTCSADEEERVRRIDPTVDTAVRMFLRGFAN